MLNKKNQNSFIKEAKHRNNSFPSILETGISDYFHKIGTDLTYEDTEEGFLEIFGGYPLIDGQAIYATSLTQGASISYQRGIKNLLGYAENEFNAQTVMNWYHPKQTYLAHRIIKGIVYYGLTTKEKEIQESSLLLYTKLRKKDGSYIPVLRQTSFYGRNKLGQMTGAVSVITDLTHMSFSDKIEWKIVGLKIDQEWLKTYITHTFSTVFSKREKDVLELLQKRMTSDQVAEILFISKNTVDTHRRNMLKKVDVSNTDELLEFAKQYGILHR